MTAIDHEERAMNVKRIHPYVESADPEVARDFYVGVFGLKVAMQQPVVGLRSRQVPSAQLIITPRGTGTPPADFGIDVGDGAAVDVAHERARAMGMRIVYPVTNEPWGVRRFFVEDPDGRIVNVLAHLQDELT
jgi:catechol 2,3-dioxygenase-like lactoylglutathione lyase family enzyme